MSVEKLQGMLSSLTFETSSCPRDSELDEFLDIVNEQVRELKRIESLSNKLQTECKAAKDKLAYLEKERTTARRELSKFKDDHESVTKKVNKLKTEIQDIKYRIKQENRRVCINDREREILSQNETELSTYKALTGIRWNFDVPKDVIEGLITNTRKNFVKTIELKKTAPSKKIKETLWNYIKEAGMISWDDLNEDKENQQ